MLEFRYTLTQEEALKGLKYSGIYKTSGKRAVVETSVLIVLFLVFFISYFLFGKEIFNLIMSFITLGLILGIILVPRFDMYKQAKQTQLPIQIKLSENKFVIHTGEIVKEVFLDGSSPIKIIGKEQKLITVLIHGGGLLVLPVRAIPENIRNQVMNLLLQAE